MKNIKAIYFVILSCACLLWSCESSDQLAEAGGASGSGTGIAGSYARFLVIGDFLYTITTENIRTFSLEDPSSPTLVEDQVIGNEIESIFALGSKLFIGSAQALYLYEINAEGLPVSQGLYDYRIFQNECANFFDPVVANETYAYVTLSSEIDVLNCNGTATELVNELRIFDVTDFNNPQLLAQYQMEKPKGVGLDGQTVFICDDVAGLKVYDVTNPLEIELLAHFNDFTAFDVIPLNGLLLVVGPDNLYQFDYTDLNDIQRIAEIPIVRS